MTSRVKHNSAGLRAAPGAGRGAVQETREHLFLCDRGDCCLAAAASRCICMRSSPPAPATTMSPLTAAPPHQRGTGPEWRQQSLRVKIHVMGQFLILQ